MGVGVTFLRTSVRMVVPSCSIQRTRLLPIHVDGLHYEFSRQIPPRQSTCAGLESHAAPARVVLEACAGRHAVWGSVLREND
jgi:hypothetical protein